MFSRLEDLRAYIAIFDGFNKLLLCLVQRIMKLLVVMNLGLLLIMTGACDRFEFFR